MCNLAEYKKMLVEALHARASGDGYGEDAILDMLDRLWSKMTPEEREAANKWGSKLAETNLDAAGNVIENLPEIV